MAQRHPLPPPWVLLIAALGLGFLLRAAWHGAVDTQPVTDFHWYYLRGAEIAEGLGYQVDGSPTAYWPVGYPAALGLIFLLFGPSVAAGKAFGLVLSLSVIPLVYWLGERLYRSGWVGAGAAFLAALYPPFIAYSGILASENLYIPLTLLALLWMTHAGERWWIWAAAGAVVGVTALVRPQAAVLPFILVPLVCLFDGENLRAGRIPLALALTFLGMSLPLTPWLIRCHQVFGRFVFVSTNGGDNLLIGHHEGATGRYKNPDKCGLVRSPELDEGERDKAASAAALAYIRQHPLRPFEIAPAKISASLAPGMDAAYWAFQKEFGFLTTPGRGSDKGLYLAFREASFWAQALLLTWGASAMVLSALARQGPWTPLAMALLTMLLAVAFFGNPRFGLPLAPFWMLSGLAIFRKQGALAREEPAPPPEA